MGAAVYEWRLVWLENSIPSGRAMRDGQFPAENSTALPMA